MVRRAAGYVLIQSTASSYVLPEIGAKFDWLCPGEPQPWHHPRAGTGSVDVRLAERIYAQSMINVVWRCRVGVMKRQFLAALGDALVERCFHIGRVFHPDGSLDENWATCRGKHRVVVRGTRNVTWQRCTLCGAVQYSHWDGQDLIWPAPNPAVEILDDNGSCLVFRQDIADSILTGRKWRGIRAEKIEAAPTPLDGVAEVFLD